MIKVKQKISGCFHNFDRDASLCQDSRLSLHLPQTGPQPVGSPLPMGHRPALHAERARRWTLSPCSTGPVGPAVSNAALASSVFSHGARSPEATIFSHIRI